MFTEEYNTQRPDIILREYGRNLQKMVQHLLTIEDTDKRNQQAKIVVEMMRQLSPNPNNQDQIQKIWDDMQIMGDFKLDIESPFPKPEPELLGKKPKRMDYNTNQLRKKHYGRNVDLMIEEILKLEDEKEKHEATVFLAKLMKSFYNTWNKEVLDDEVILHDLREMSGYRLNLDADQVKNDNLLQAQKTKRTGTGFPPAVELNSGLTFSGSNSGNNNSGNNNRNNNGGGNMNRRNNNNNGNNRNGGNGGNNNSRDSGGRRRRI
ncbi:MAG TPA: DUF4290 domain-containing protein [Cytophagales bacterium]|nr:DUF4290 domain-containing protein [Cytophagales bacterium]